jgi:hypothetical protein
MPARMKELVATAPSVTEDQEDFMELFASIPQSLRDVDSAPVIALLFANFLKVLYGRTVVAGAYPPCRCG